MERIEQNMRLVAEALRAAACQKCYYYPGMKGDIIANAINGHTQASLNERNALEFGYGACLAGARTVVIMKTVGLATCLDSLQHAVIQGVNGGMVIIILEDTVAKSSPEIVDSRLMMDYAAVMVIEPGSLESAVQHLQSSFALSENLDTPIVIRLTYDLLESEPIKPVITTQEAPADRPRPNYRQKMIGTWPDRVAQYNDKLERIDTYIDDIYAPVADKPYTSICFGYKKDRGPQELLVEHYPIATSLLRTFAQHETPIYELGSNYAAQKLRSGLRLRVDNTRAPSLEVKPFSDWEQTLKTIDKSSYNYIVGDEGKFTLDSTDLVDICLCMGSSIAVCAGMSDVTGSKNLAIIGDFSYLFNGYQGILEAYHRNINMDILLLDDQQASSTGGQPSVARLELHPVAALVSACTSYNFSETPTSLFGDESRGISLCRVQKDNSYA